MKTNYQHLLGMSNRTLDERNSFAAPCSASTVEVERRTNLPTTYFSADDEHRRELSRKLQLLMDVVEAKEGKAPTYPELADALASEGVRLSRARWAYMLSGNGPVVRDRLLLAGVAHFFGVDPVFLMDHSSNGIPELIEAQLKLVREHRRQQVIDFATRSLNQIATAEDIRQITEALARLAPTTEPDIGERPQK